MFVFPAGEKSKHLGTISEIYKTLADFHMTRKDIIVALGGGVCGEGDPLLIPMREKTMSRPYFGPGVKKTRIELAQMGNDAGIVGAAMMGKSCVDDGKNGK